MLCIVISLTVSSLDTAVSCLFYLHVFHAISSGRRSDDQDACSNVPSTLSVTVCCHKADIHHRRESGDLTVAPLRDNVMQLFFKRLTSHDEELVEAARAGLAAVVAHQRMPKQLLQVTSCEESV
jgi:hypothetical protein